MNLQANCDLCREVLLTDDIVELGKWVFHAGCHDVALYRLTDFIQIILLPEKEFNEWLEDE